MKFVILIFSALLACSVACAQSAPTTIPLTDLEAARINRLNMEYAAAQHQTGEAVRHAQIYLQQLNAAHPGYHFDPATNMLMLTPAPAPTAAPAPAPVPQAPTATHAGTPAAEPARNSSASYPRAPAK